MYARQMNWPGNRNYPFKHTTPNLRACWTRSRDLLRRLRQEMSAAGITPAVRTVYVSGSLGRMEAVAGSDCDVVVVLTEADRSNRQSDIMDSVFDCISRTGFQRPKHGGIFGSPTSFEELLDPSTTGKIDEDLSVFGKRIQALLDSQPLLHSEEFESLQQAILERYASAPVADPNAFALEWLEDDLIRYWRSLCARARWLEHDDQPTWRMLNVKLRHSRRLLCAGLFRLLLQVRGSADPIHDLMDLLKLVPLERLTNDDDIPESDNLIAAYDYFMAAMSKGLTAVVRDRRAFDKLIANGAALSRIIGKSDNDWLLW